MKVNILTNSLKTLLIGFCLLISSVPILFTLQQLSAFNVSHKNLLGQDLIKLLSLNNSVYPVIYYITKILPKNAVILAFQQSNLAMYSDKHFVSFMDPMLIPVYKADSEELAYKLLKQIGINYIYIPNFSDPTFFNSQIANLTGDPKYTELLYQSGFSRIYKLREKPDLQKLQPIFIQNNNFSSKGEKNLPYNWVVLDKRGLKIAQNWRIPKNKHGIEIYNKSTLYGNKTEALLVSGSGPLDYKQEPVNHSNKLLANTTYILHTKLKGHGFYTITVANYEKNGVLSSTSVIWKGVLGNKYKDIRTQFISTNVKRYFRLVYTLYGPGDLQVKNVDLFKLGENQNYASLHNSTGWKVIIANGILHNLLHKFGSRDLQDSSKILSCMLIQNGIVFKPLSPKTEFLLSPSTLYSSKTKDYIIGIELHGHGVLNISLLVSNSLGISTLHTFKSLFLTKTKQTVDLKITRDMIPVLLGDYSPHKMALLFQLTKFNKKPLLDITNYKVSQEM